MDQQLFVSRLKEAREKKGLTIKELAEACGVSLPAMNRYVALKAQPSLEIACKMANALGVSLDWLCSQEEKPQMPTLGQTVKYLSLLLTTEVTKNKMVAYFEKNTDGTACIRINQCNFNGMIRFDTWKKILELHLNDDIDEEMYFAWIEKKIKDLDRIQLPIGDMAIREVVYNKMTREEIHT